MKMAGVDMDLFNNHNKMDTQPDKTSETISLNPGGVGGAATWEPEQETSFGGRSIREKVLREHVEGLYQKLTEIKCHTPEEFHFDDFELRDGELYYKGKSMPLMIGEGGGS